MSDHMISHMSNHVDIRMGDPGAVAESVVLVDEADRQLGVADKMEVHRTGAMHRAFSVFLFDPAGRVLLQRRAFDKYHSGGLWSNTCCSHPRPMESVLDAAARRLPEEMGLTAPLEWAFRFIYRADFENGLIEHELDHVLVGRTSPVDALQGASAPIPTPNPTEVADWRWVSPEQVRMELVEQPDQFTVWFRLCFERAVASAQHNGS